MGMIFKRTLILILLAFTSGAFAQLTQYSNPWVSLGPNEAPKNPKYRGDAGIGPIEFIRVYQKKEGYLLAGSLSGGLFFSENGGDSWLTTGSDNWDYTGCAWADFYPEDERTWFACSNYEGDNGKPGRLEKKGGILRSTDAGESWDMIGNYKDFGGSGYIRIYGTRFHPDNPNLLFVLTSEGFYYTENCLEQFVKWKRVPNVKGWVYDMDFMDGKLYITNFFHGKWDILEFDQDFVSDPLNMTFKKLAPMEPDDRSMRNLTIEPKYGELLVAKDLVKGGDELCVYNPQGDSMYVFLENQRIGFGSGYTFAVSPHDTVHFYLGYSTQVRKWSYPARKSVRVGRGYHVDVEFVAYDPFDSLKIYFATHGGVFISTNGGVNWENKSDNMGVAEVMGLAVSKSDPNQVVIGCYHDGTMLLTDYTKDSAYYWQTVNGGDGLLPLVDPYNKTLVYTSNQFTGGGLYYWNSETKKTKKNMHALNNLKTSGWEMAVVMHPKDNNTIYFNYLEDKGINKGNINICRTKDPIGRKAGQIISDFNASHKLKNYKVYGLFNSDSHPDVLIAYVLNYIVDSEGKKRTLHRLFRTDIAYGEPMDVMKSWYEISHPNNAWIADVEIDHENANKIYLSYTKGKDKPESIFGDRGMVYMLQYRNNARHSLKREIDISKNIPISQGGRYNMVYTEWDGGTLFIATRTGVYMGQGKTLKGKSRWRKIGVGLPHCKVYGIDFNEKERIITVGLFGRGVWQYRLK